MQFLKFRLAHCMCRNDVHVVVVSPVLKEFVWNAGEFERCVYLEEFMLDFACRGSDLLHLFGFII